MTPFVLNACKNIKVMRLTIKHERPSVFELKVVAKGNDEIEYEAIANDQFIVDKNRVVWLEANDEKQIPYVCQYYDPVNDITRRCPNPLNNAILVSRVNGLRMLEAVFTSGETEGFLNF